MAQHNDTGKEGEAHALVFLKEKGYEILEVNYTWKHLEVDIIARLGQELVVVEVKTRTANYFGEPEVFVDRKKQRNLISAANAYVQQNNIDMEVRFDIIAILTSSSKTNIHHIEGAFYPLL